LREPLLGLGGEIDENAAVGMLRRSLDDRVETRVTVDQHGRGETRVEAQQRAMRAIGIEAEKRQRMIDQVLRQEPRHQGLADPALFSAQQMNVRHHVSPLSRTSPVSYHCAAHLPQPRISFFRYTGESIT
jgi:hypothetical protein